MKKNHRHIQKYNGHLLPFMRECELVVTNDSFIQQKVKLWTFRYTNITNQLQGMQNSEH